MREQRGGGRIGGDEQRHVLGSSTAVSRRRALQLGAATAGLLALNTGRAAAQTNPVTPPAALLPRDQSFDQDWRFFRGDAAGADAPSFDDSSWRVLDLPHDWSIEDLPQSATGGAATSEPSLLTTQVPPPETGVPQLIGPFDTHNSAGGGATAYTVGGIGWYRKEFQLPALGADQHVELRFDGVYENADFWLNGVHLGFHPYGYTTFAFDVTPQLNRTGTNVLAVRVDNSGVNSRWYSGSGIYRHTWLTVTGPLRIPLWGIAVTTPVVNEQQSVAHVEVSVANLGTIASTTSVRVTVLDPHGAVVATSDAPAQTVDPGATTVSLLDIAIQHAALWSPEAPNVYTAQAEVMAQGQVVDTVSTTFGIRSLSWNGRTGLLLNGKPIKLVGGNLHSQNGPMGAVALDRSEQRKIEILKAAGFTAVRTAHNPPTPAMLDACDRLGMLVWEEFFDVWDTGKNPDDYSRFFPMWWPQDLGGTVLRDRNHPSVVIWSLGNEITDNTGGRRGAELANAVRALDRTRPITVGGGSTSPTDPSWQYVDIGDVHYNANGQGYAQLHAAHPDKALTHSQTFPTTIYQDITFVADNPWAVGTWVWAAWDYLGDSGIGKTATPPVGTSAGIGDQDVVPGWALARALHHSWGGAGYPYPYFQANCGDVDLIGQRKPQNYWRAVVTGLSTVEMLVLRPTPAGTEQDALLWGYFDELQSWTWNVAPETPMIVHVYTLGDSVSLLLNGTPVATARLTAANQAVATLTVPYRPGELTAVASRAGREIGRKTLTTVGPAQALRLTPDVAHLTTHRDDLAHVLVEVVDGSGRVIPDAVRQVTFTVNGAGALVATGNGNPHNVDSFQQPERFTWHGQALAILRPAKTAGSLTLNATTPGLQPATLTLSVTP